MGLSSILSEAQTACQYLITGENKTLLCIRIETDGFHMQLLDSAFKKCFRQLCFKNKVFKKDLHFITM